MSVLKSLISRELLFRLISSVVVVTMLVSVWWALEAFKPAPKEKSNKVKKVKVFVQPVTSQSTYLSVSAQGVAMPKSEIVLRSQVEGQVEYVSPNFLAGGQFKQGELLLRLVPEDFELVVVQRRAKVKQAREAFARAEAESQNAIVELSELNRTDASALAKKIPQLARAQADLDSAEAALKQAELNLSRTEIRAPFDGMVRKETVATGQFVTRNANLATLFSVAEMEIRLPLRGEQLSQLALPFNYFATPETSLFPVNLSASVADSLGRWQGHIVRTEGVMDQGTRTVYAVVHVEAPYDVLQGEMPLVSGLYVDAIIQGRSIDNAVILPRKAIRTNNKVWLVDKQDTLRITDVAVVSRDHHTAVVTGLMGRNRVVTSALVMAVDGLSVRAIVPEENPQQSVADGPIIPKSDGPSGVDKKSNEKRQSRKLKKGRIKGSV